MTKQEIIEAVNGLIAAPSCCPEAKAAGEAYLAAIGTDGQKAAADALIAELEEDVCSIEGLIEFTGSDFGKKVFGEEGAKKMNADAKAAKEKGERYCICPACQAGGKLLDSRADL